MLLLAGERGLRGAATSEGEDRERDDFIDYGWIAMSVMGIIGLVWLGFGVITVVVAKRQKLPLVIWIIAALILGPWSVFWVAAAVANKRKLPPYRGGSSRYGAGGTYGGGLGG